MKSTIKNKPLPKKKIWIKRGIWLLVAIFILMNVMAIFHSYKLTHFSNGDSERTKDAKTLTTGEKIKTLVFGVSNPRPRNKTFPAGEYQTIRLKSNKEIECWLIKAPDPKGTVVLFHGYGGEKSLMLDKAEVFRELGYHTFLVDFMGSGGSEGNRTTIGYAEAEQVRSCFEYLKNAGEQNIYLFGTSMGAVAIMKAINNDQIHPKGIIIECPFGTMYETVCARFRNANAPTFPMAALLVFWGGVQNGYWAFGHNPVDYASNINCPTLLLYGAKDDRVSRQEIDRIFANLAGPKRLKIYPGAGHENFLIKYKSEWTQDVIQFLNAY
ncbi:MAG TPA: alpha/beta fold hydrolase [Flavisolibacter sp.]